MQSVRFILCFVALLLLVGQRTVRSAVILSSRNTSVNTNGTSSSSPGPPYTDSQTNSSTAPGVYGPYSANGSISSLNANYSNGSGTQDATIGNTGGGLQLTVNGKALSNAVATQSPGGTANNSTISQFVLDFSVQENTAYSLTGSLDSQAILTGSAINQSFSVLAQLRNLTTSQNLANTAANGAFNFHSNGPPGLPINGLTAGNTYELTLQATASASVSAFSGSSTSSLRAEFDSVALTLTPVPEPSTALTLACAGLLAQRLRRAVPSR